MSLSLFNAVPAGAIEVIFDSQNQPWFKRADEGKYLGMVNIAESVANIKDAEICTRNQIEKGLKTIEPLSSRPKHANPHDVFLSLGTAIEVSIRSNKPNGKKLKSWIIKEIIPRGLNDIIQKHQLALAEKQQAIEDRQAIQNENVGLQYELERIRPRCVEPRGDYDNILVPFVKNKTDEIYPYYMIRCQYRNLDKQTNMLRVKYPNMRVKGEYDDPNAVHHWVTFKKYILGKDNYHFNNFRLDGEHRELFEGMFNIEM